MTEREGVNWDASRFEHALKEATREAFLALKRNCPDEHLYVFGLFANDVANYVYPTANTEEAFHRRFGAGMDLEEPDVRWLPGEWDYHLAGDEYFERVQQLLMEFDPYDVNVPLEEVEAHARQVLESSIRVLRELDEEGLFGRGAEREALVLSLLLNDMSYEQQVEWAKRLNPESVTNRLECALAAATEVLERRQLERARSTREIFELMNETPPGRE